MNSKNMEAGNQRVSKNWCVFELKLTSVLSQLVEDQMLIIVEKDSNRFIQFAAQGSAGMRAEVSSNAYLSPSNKLTDRQIAKLVKAGWDAPTHSP